MRERKTRLDKEKAFHMLSLSAAVPSSREIREEREEGIEKNDREVGCCIALHFCCVHLFGEIRCIPMDNFAEKRVDGY